MNAQLALDDETLLHRWREFANDPGSPDRYEIDEHGALIVTPPPVLRQQGIGKRIGQQLEAQLGGAALQEVAVLAPGIGVRVPDVIWLPHERPAEIETTTEPMQELRPIVVEVLSPSNRGADVENKIAAYLDAGAKEVIVVALDGAITFHRAGGAHERSAFGVTLELPAGFFPKD